MNHIYSLKRSTEVAIWTASRNESTTGSNITITDAAAAPAVDLRIYGRTSDGHSVGENGLTVTACGKNLFNINGRVNAGQHWNLTPKWYDNYSGSDANTVSNGVLTANADQSNVHCWGQIINIKENVYYNVTFKATSLGTGTAFAVDIYTYTPDQSATTLYSNHYTTLDTTITVRFKSSSYSGPVVFGFGSFQGHGAQITEIQVEEADAATAYTAYQSSTIIVTTALPLRSNGDVKDEIDFAAGVAITRISSEGAVLETPVTTPLSSAESTAFNAFALFAGYTNITATDDPTMYIEYQKAVPTRTTTRRRTRKK